MVRQRVIDCEIGRRSDPLGAANGAEVGLAWSQLETLRDWYRERRWGRGTKNVNEMGFPLHAPRAYEREMGSE